MNSLTYLSRQFDVLASPRAPPSTPTTESPPNLVYDPTSDRRGEYQLKRVRTSVALGLPPGYHHLPHTPKRSMSLPPGIVFAHSPVASLPPPPASARRHSVSVSGTAIRPKHPSDTTSALRRVFFIRVFLILWNSLAALWTSITRRGIVRTQHEVAVEEGAETDEKDSEDESRDEKIVLPPPTSEPSPALPPPPAPLHPPTTPSIPSSSPNTQHPAMPRFISEVDPQPHIDSQSEMATSPQTPLPPSLPPSRSSTTTPTTPESTQHPPARKAPVFLPKTLVLDLDETLIHSTSRPIHQARSGWSLFGLGGLFGRRDKSAGKIVEVVLGGKSTLYHVYKRPYVDYFLRKVSGWYTLVIFTASMQEYADPVIDWLDAGRGILVRRLFRESCTQLPNGTYLKDLSVVEQDLATVCLVDNSPISYWINEANGIPIEGWTQDPHDEALLDLLPVLDSLRFTSDVRRVLGIRGFS
ncbi:hypothetical protein JAAARDRAFT_27896 [Jaapia argillacea MUCL 33604]|uniref:FCP1 homology domain-containing protein n=1 Tax=Jaapia argillacea MUCL 33604 TaxID=933084 RepID=A0A067QBB5_9AGAM|nr:hypothetical protein JAAARDRAFT_27896 [Jaapia argillacea MUCL 33604]